jgi:hypothetical protein
LGFLVNMSFVVISRTALVTVPIMLAVFALLHLKLRTTMIAFAVATLLAMMIWNVSPGLRSTVSKFFIDYRSTVIQNNPTGVGSRLEFWQKSLNFFAEAPVIGHGTGSTRGLFEQAAVGQIGARAEIVGNPHNQTLYVAVQWGTIGVIALLTMWASHLSLFRGEGLTAWIGLMVVVQNVFTSLFNSHLFDFHEGWMYVLGVGVAGGMTLGAAPHPSSRRAVFAASATQVFLKVLTGFACVVFLFGSWFLSNYFRALPPDSALDRETRAIVTALRVYRIARGAYPVLPVVDSLTIDLKKQMARDGFLGPQFQDIAGPDKEARYVSYDGKVYGLLFHEPGTGENPSGKCFIEVGTSGTGWWGQPPKCQFQAAACLEPFAMFADPACWKGLAWRY